MAPALRGAMEIAYDHDLSSYRTNCGSGLLLAVSAGTVAAQNNGIKVHGRWTIEVRNADGSVAFVYVKGFPGAYLQTQKFTP